MNLSLTDLLAIPNRQLGKVQFIDSKVVIFDNGQSFPIINQIPVLLKTSPKMSKEAFYEQFYQSQAEPWSYSERAAEILRHEYIAHQVRGIYERTGKKLTILDLGCSLGHITALLHTYGELIVGLDISLTAVTKAKTRCEQAIIGAKNPYQFVVGDVLNLPFQKEAFDVIIISDGIHEWFESEEDRKRAINNVYQVLKRQGQAIFTDYINPSKFADFVALVQTSPFRISHQDLFYDRLWYRLESWTKAFQKQQWVKNLLANVNLARKLRSIGKYLGKNYSKHLAIIAQK